MSCEEEGGGEDEDEEGVNDIDRLLVSSGFDHSHDQMQNEISVGDCWAMSHVVLKTKIHARFE